MAKDDRGDLDLTKRIDILEDQNKRLKSLANELYSKLVRERKKLKRYHRFVTYQNGGIPSD